MNKGRIMLINALLAGIFLVVAGQQGGVQNVRADCNLPGTSHGDNSPSEKKGEKMVEAGASACEIAKSCDAMKISIDIEKDELHDTNVYQLASGNEQDDMDNAVKEGHGADGLYCYELEQIMD